MATDLDKLKLADEKGAASVLVIFMMMVLVTLGAFAITSANANYKFSRRSVDWNTMYYSLDARGEEYLSELDFRLAEAETFAVTYAKNQNFQKPELDGIPAQLQDAIYRDFQGKAISDIYINEVINKIYLYYASQYLTELSLTFEGSEVYTIENGEFIDSVLAQVNMKSDRPGDEKCSLNISIWVEPLKYTSRFSGSGLSVVRANDNLRYKIEDWYEYQEPIDEEPASEELWDGTV